VKRQIAGNISRLYKELETEGKLKGSQKLAKALDVLKEDTPK
jgi:hypothetical protein